MVFNLDDREMDESFLLSAPTGPNRIPGRRKFRGGPPRYLIFLRRFRMRVRRGLKGTPRVTTFLGHRLTNEKREKFVFFFFYILLLLLPRENTMDRPREIINYYYYRARRRDS